MFANKPEMAKEWASETPKGTKLPERVGDKKTKKEAGLLGRLGIKTAAELGEGYVPPPVNPDLGAVSPAPVETEETFDQHVDPGFAEATQAQQVHADAADAAAAARVRADAGGSTLLPPAPVTPPAPPVSRTPAPALPAPKAAPAPIMPSVRPPQPGNQVKPRPPQPGQQLQKRPVQPGQMKRSAMKTAEMTALKAALIGAGIGGAGVGGYAGGHAHGGRRIADVLRPDIADEMDRIQSVPANVMESGGKGALLGAGVGAVAGLGVYGASQLLKKVLGRNKAKTAAEAPGPNKRTPSWAQPTPATPPVAPVAPVAPASSAPTVPGPNKRMPSTMQPVKTGSEIPVPQKNKTNHPPRYTATATSGKKLAAVLKARKRCG
jgi:hypothetical protein